MNSVIEQAFSGYSVPVSFLYYDGAADTYIVYQETDRDGVLIADDQPRNYISFYDVDIYSKTNYIQTMNDVIERMTGAGFRWDPSRSSPDMFDEDTGLFHKTLCFSIERSV